MDDEAIQKGAPVVPPREPLTPDYGVYGRFPPATRERDKQHLKMLSIFYFIAAGLLALTALGMTSLIVLGVFFITSVPATPNGPPPEIGYFFIGVGAFILVLYGIYAYFLYLAGRSLREYKRRTLIFVMAILLCLGFPWIILGVFTIIVLSRESVKDLFAHGDTAYPRDEDT